MKIASGFLVLIFLLGCTADRTAYYQYSCPIGEPPQHIISFTAPTGKWGLGHSLIYRETQRSFAFTLQTEPIPNTMINHNEFNLIERDGLQRINVPLADGYIDIRKQEIFLNLHTPEGPFWANGGYVFSEPLSATPKQP